jgi:hypothetical protein
MVTVWRITHNITVTPQCIYQWRKRGNEDCPMCMNTHGTLGHMFLEWLDANALWKWLTGTLRYLIGPHNVDSKVIIYGYNPSTSAAQQLANYFLVLGKSTIYKTYMAANAEYRPPPNYYRLLQLWLRYRTLLELHKSIAINNLDSFKSYWLHKQALAKMKNGN